MKYRNISPAGCRRTCTSWLFSAMLAAVFAGMCWPAFAQLPRNFQDLLTGAEETRQVGETVEREQPIGERIEALRGKLEIARTHYENAVATSEAAAAVQFGVDSQEVEERNSLLRSLHQTYQRNISVLEKLQETRASRAELDAQIEAWQGFPEAPPYRIDFVDELRGQVHTEDVAIQAIRDQLAVLEDFLRRLRDQAANAERAYRDAVRAVETAARTADMRAVQWNADKSRIARLAAQATLNTFEDEALGMRETLEYHQTAKAFAGKRLAIAARNAPFTQEELEEKLERIRQAIERNEQELEAAREEKVAADEALSEAREALRAAREIPAEEADEAHPATVSRLEQLLAVRQAEAETAAAVIDSLEVLMSVRNAQASVWRQRYETARTDDYVKLAEVRRLLADWLQSTESWGRYFDSNLRRTETQVRTLQSRLAAWRPETGDETLARQELEALERREEMFRRGVSRIDEIARLLRNWRDEIEAQQQEAARWERIVGLAQGFLARVWGLWSYPLLTVQDSSITLSKIARAIVILLLGLYLSRKSSIRIRKMAIDRFHAEESFAASLEKGLYYALAIAVVLFALNAVEIPLTVFAFFGGALAIGVGFGAQTLINNFISGIIMLIERPIKVGDIVDVEGVRGRVVNIGSRCCQVRLFDGIDILVPNSIFLEQKVVNWTLSDSILRFSVSVGVAYGSPTRDVAQLIEKAVNEHGRVLKTPPPVILFEEFGDNSLKFTVNFWLEVGRPMDFRIVCSDIRFRIDRLFREAGITIAFPQRDVHVETMSPLRIALVDPDAAEPEKPEKPRLPDIKRKKK